MLKLYYNENTIEVGCDEAGRGCLAGPVYAAAVILPQNFDCKNLNDSKQLSKKNRTALRKYIEESALAYAVAQVSPKEIDEINILNASIQAMHKALEQIKIEFDFILVDGNKFKKYNNIPHSTIVQGDALYASIAAASILAKTYRDEYMETIHQECPYYKWDKNKGYPTTEHRTAIEKHGVSPYHRLSYKLLPDKTLFD